jgi:hypothetical protein
MNGVRTRRRVLKNRRIRGFIAGVSRGVQAGAL